MSEETFDLSLTQAEVQALYRATLEYEKALRFSALRDSTLVGGELTQLQNIQEKVSLTFFFPAKIYPGEQD